MKNTNKLVVAYGPDVPVAVLNFTCKDFALDIDLERGETTIATVNDKTFVYYESYEEPIDSEVLTDALWCLEDHIKNVPESELRANIAEDDYHCANPIHIVDSAIECHCSLPDCIAVTVYEFTYYAPDCVVSVYYTVPA
jgi:hypothetical protein